MGDKRGVERHHGRIQKILCEKVLLSTITFNMEDMEEI